MQSQLPVVKTKACKDLARQIRKSNGIHLFGVLCLQIGNGMCAFSPVAFVSYEYHILWHDSFRPWSTLCLEGVVQPTPLQPSLEASSPRPTWRLTCNFGPNSSASSLLDWWSFCPSEVSWMSCQSSSGHSLGVFRPATLSSFWLIWWAFTSWAQSWWCARVYQWSTGLFNMIWLGPMRQTENNNGMLTTVCFHL